MVEKRCENCIYCKPTNSPDYRECFCEKNNWTVLSTDKSCNKAALFTMASDISKNLVGFSVVGIKPEPEWHYKNPYKWLYNHVKPIECWIYRKLFNKMKFYIKK